MVIWNKVIRVKEEAALNNPVVLHIWSYEKHGLKEAPLQNSISSIFAKT